MTNTGDRNTGYLNTGNRNIGDRNTGDRNTGNYNTGDRNTGRFNTGNRNTGSFNTGSRNTGNLNTGFLNTGSFNTGSFNKANYCFGFFNTEQPKMRLFNKEIDITPKEFYDKYNICAEIKLTEWIPEAIMTEEEKIENQTYKITGGYIKKREYKDACRLRWRNANEEERKIFLSLPGFDSEIFEEITGIDVNNKEEEMTLDEVCKELGRNIKIVK